MDVLTCVEASVSSKCFDCSKMAAEVLPVAHTDEYSKSGEPAIHVLRSGVSASDESPPTTDILYIEFCATNQSLNDSRHCRKLYDKH